jgi:hypothetical protein
MLQVKIRTLMIWVLFVAVFLALITPGIRSTGPDRGSIWVLTVLGVPLGMAGLSAVVLRPGASRDWVTGFFLALPCVMIGLVLAAAVYHGWVPPKVVGTWKAPVNRIIIFLFAFTLWCVLIPLAKVFLVPRRCPCCRKRGLLKSMREFSPREPERTRGENERAYNERKEAHRKRLLFAFYRCGVCDCEAFLSLAQARQGCPRCGRDTMLHSFRTKEGARRRWGYYWYQFFWCMRCGARSKQMLPGTWEPAASPGDDSHYWGSTYRDWLKHATTAARMR